MTATRYRAPPADALLLHPLDPLCAVYHRAAGTTHLVASPVPEILAALAPAPLTPADLLATLESTYALADADLEALQERLEELAEAGLVWAE